MLQKERLTRAHCFETRERFIEISDALEIVVCDKKRFVQFERDDSTAALRRRSSACTIHEQIPHHLRRQPEKMRAVGEIDARSVNEANVGLVNEIRRVQRIFSGRCAQPLVRELAQAFVDQRDELFPGAFVAGAPLPEKPGDLRWNGCDVYPWLLSSSAYARLGHLATSLCAVYGNTTAGRRSR